MNTTINAHAHRLRRVFVWQLPVRVYHWVNALCILALIGTGIIIGNPPAVITGREATFSFWFGTTRFIHFIAAYVFLFNFIFRIYWGFVGNKYASWRNFIPSEKGYFKDMWKILKSDIFMTRGYNYHTVGHNRLAGFIYFLTFIAFGVQCLTGFGMYSAMSDWWFPQLFAWIPFLFGGDLTLRLIHHLAMWFFILFAIVHVYLVFYHDYVEGHGELSSMGGGWKFIEEDTFQKNLDEQKEEKQR